MQLKFDTKLMFSAFAAAIAVANANLGGKNALRLRLINVIYCVELSIISDSFPL